MLDIQFNMVETLAIAVVVLLFGKFLRKKINILERFFIPAPVIGGTIFSLILLIGHVTKLFSFEFDGILKDFFMLVFFTTIGFTASAKLLKKGGIGVAIFLFTATLLAVVQNIVGVSLAKIFNLNPLLGLAVGSIPLTGGHGTSGAFGIVLEELGVQGAFSVAIAAATYGLISGCLIGGPIAKKLKEKYALEAPKETKTETSKEESNGVEAKGEEGAFEAIVVTIIAMGLGYWLAPFLKKYGIVFPIYIGPMIVAAIIRNIADGLKKPLPLKAISITGNISLALFLAMALMALKLWELAALAVPIVTILLVQTVITGIFIYFITFRLNGKDYDAAVILTGHCGFALGATPNAMANMDAFMSENGFAPRAFFVLPIVGALFIDFTNATVITFFINIFG